jgi:hypothetical protein
MPTDYTQDANCLGAWLFEEGTGTDIDDASSNNNHGTLLTPDWYNTTTAGAWSSWALDFIPANTDVVSFGDLSIIDNLTAFTVIGFVKPDGTGAGGIFTKYDDNDNTGGKQILFWTTSGLVVITVSADGASDSGQEVSSATLSTSTWNSVAGAYDGTKLYTYTNGTEHSTNYSSGIKATSAQPLNVGRRAYTGASQWYFDGKIDEFAFFNRKLSSTEINDIKDNGLKQTGGGVATEIDRQVETFFTWM